MLPSSAPEHVDAVGTSGTADSAQRDRADPTPSDVQLLESNPLVGQATANKKPFVVGLRGRRCVENFSIFCLIFSIQHFDMTGI